MSNEQQYQKAIKELRMLEAMADSMKQRAYTARVVLERISSPAPSGVKRVLTEEKKASLVVKFRKSTLKKKAI